MAKERAEHQTAVVARETARTEHRTAVLERWTVALGIVSSLLLLGGSALGFWTASLSAANTSLETDVAALVADKEGLERSLAAADALLQERASRIDDLEAENAILQAFKPDQIDLDEEHDIRKAGRVTLAADGDSIKLNSTLRNFDVGERGFAADELYYKDEQLRVGGGLHSIDLLTLDEGPANYATCAAATGYRETRSVEVHALEANDVCIRLQSGRFAVILTESYTQGEVDIMVTVWE